MTTDQLPDRAAGDPRPIVTPHATEQIAKASRELDRLHALLTEAITALITHFESLATLTEEQQTVSREAIAQAIDASVQAALAARQREVETGVQEHLNGALIALQFQDMSSQLINHVRERMTVLKAELTTPGQTTAVVHSDSPVRSDGAFGKASSGRRGGAVELF